MRYTSVDGDAQVFRLVYVGGVHLPASATLPLPHWLRPTTEDVEEGKRIGRPPGLSTWDAGVTTKTQAAAFLHNATPTPWKAFQTRVGAVRDLACKRVRSLDVLTDPLDDLRPGAEGHCRIEGLQRPTGMLKRTQDSFLVDMVSLFSEVH